MNQKDNFYNPDERYYFPYYYEREYKHPNKYRDWLRLFPKIVIYPRDAEELKGKWSKEGKPLCVDIGCAEADFLIEQAKRNPECEFVGIEIKFKRVFKSARKVLEHDLKNVRLVRYDASFLYRLFAPGEIDVLYVLFPDPWHKKKQQKHRIFNPKTLQLWLYLIKPGGIIEIKTDHRDYFESMQEVVANFSDEVVIEANSFDLNNEPEIAEHLAKSRYENTFSQLERPINYMRLKKKL